MVCPNCKTEAARIVIRVSGSHCPNCSNIAETAGASVSGIITRTSSRVRNQQEKHRGDVVIPHTYDKASGKIVPNPDFVKLYPEQTAQYFDEQEVKSSGNKKLGKLWEQQTQQQTEHQKELDKLAHGTRDVSGDKAKREQFVKGL